MAQGRKSRGLEFLYRRPDKPGGIYYIAYTDLTGKRVRRSLETDVLKMAKERRDAIMAGKIELRWGAADKDIATAEFWQRYEPWARMHKAKTSVDRAAIDWKHFVAFLRPKTLGSVTKSDVERLKVYLKRDVGLANVTVNDGLVRLQAMYNHARKLGWYARGNPFEGFARLSVEKKPPQFLTAKQIDAVMEKARAHGGEIHLFCALAVYGGLRAKEAAHARWEWFDFAQGTLTVQGSEDGSFGTKGKRYRTIPLHVKLREILEPIRKTEGYLINPEKTEPGKWRIRYEPKRAFASVVKAAKVEWCTPHVLRHTFASQLVQAGVSLYKVSQWLGHSDTRTTQIYAHLAPVDDDINRF